MRPPANQVLADGAEFKASPLARKAWMVRACLMCSTRGETGMENPRLALRAPEGLLPPDPPPGEELAFPVPCPPGLPQSRQSPG